MTAPIIQGVTGTGLAYPVQGFLNLAGDAVGLGVQVMGSIPGGSGPVKNYATLGPVFGAGAEETLGVSGFGFAFDGVLLWHPLKMASAANLALQTGDGVLMTVGTGEWAVSHDPAAATRATITKAAGGAFVRHVCRSITVSMACDNTAEVAAVKVYLRDGASGVGPILWSAVMWGGPYASPNITLSGLNIVGSVNTDMTLEFSAAPAANHFQAVAMTGYSND